MRARLKAAGGDDSGAALIFALIIISVIALVSAGVLALSDTSVRSTVSMRARASAAYAGDAAGEIALNQLRKGTFNGAATGCDAQTTVVMSNVYPATATAPGASAAVTCTPDENAGMGGGGANSSPGTALLTMATGVEKGILLDDSNNDSFKVKGGIFSNSTINLESNKADLENIATNSYAYALNGCVVGPAQVTVAPGSVKDCNYSTNPLSATDRRGMDPGTVAGHGLSFDAPAGPGALRTPPVCAALGVYHFDPGLYTDATRLNTYTDSNACKGSVVHLKPGNYFFNFTTGTTWNISKAFLIGGTATTSLVTTPVPTMNGTCVKPGSASATTSSGVQLVFGGTSRLWLTGNGSNPETNGNIELCGSNAASGPPIVIYGLKTAVGSVPAQSGCITATGYGSIGDAAHCPVVGSDNQPYPIITLWGTTYVPRAGIELYLNNRTSQVFRWGLLSRIVRLHSTGSSSLTQAVIDVPDDAPAPFALPSQRYLYVYVCQGSGTCSTSGKLRLRASMILSPTTPRTVTVTSWATVR
jgi:Tfp pilus assembly protein PilX